MFFDQHGLFSRNRGFCSDVCLWVRLVFRAHGSIDQWTSFSSRTGVEMGFNFWFGDFETGFNDVI